MANEITNYKCPACTGPLHFSEASGKLECDYCGSSYSVEEVERIYAEKNARAQAASNAQEEQETAAQPDPSDPGQWGEDAASVKAYNCPSCGAELILDLSTAATSCPYCGNPTIVPGQLGGSRKPDFVIPFRVSKEGAVAALKQHYKKKVLLPRAFTEENHIQEIKGVYVPFWLYDVDAQGDVTYDAAIVHHRSTSTEEITETNHYLVRRKGTMRFEKVPADGSKQMPDGHMDSIEPFDYGELKPFSLSYLPGFMANRYDVSKDEAYSRIKIRCESSMSQALNQSVMGYSTCVPLNSQIQAVTTDVKYALLPVWMLSTQWNGRNFLFAMNGQTGKLIGDLPISKGKLAAWMGGAFTLGSLLLGWFFL